MKDEFNPIYLTERQPAEEELWMEECESLMRVPEGAAYDVVELLYQIQSSRSVRQGKVPPSVMRELHQVAWESIDKHTSEATSTYNQAMAALRAVAKKIGTSDSNADIYENMTAVQKFLEEQDKLW